MNNKNEDRAFRAFKDEMATVAYAFIIAGFILMVLHQCGAFVNESDPVNQAPASEVATDSLDFDKITPILDRPR